MPLFRGRRIAKGTKILRPVRPNAGIEARYRGELLDLIRQMHESTEYWIRSAYKNNEPRIAQDAIPSDVLRIAVARLAARWQGHFDDAAQRLAEYFATAVEKRSRAALMKILKDGGWTVRFTLTPAMRDVFHATVNANVALIKSIPQQYLSQVEGLVQRSIQAGGDLKTLTDALMKRYDVTRSRAELIARDQNNKANSVFNRARQQELGITKAIWMHSHAGDTPRPTHVAMNNKPYDVAKGMWDSHEQAYVWPGQLINCFPGESKIYFADDVEKAYRHRYSGDLAELVTDSGKTIRATPNHPVLTPDGWVAAGLLDEGDYVIEVIEDVLPSVMLKHDADDAYPTLAEVFEAVSKSGMLRTEVALRDQFHGDGAADGDVDVVLAERPLSFGLKPVLPERRVNLSLAVADYSRLSRGLVEQLAHRGLRAAAGFVSRLRQSLAPRLAFVGYPDEGGSASISHFASGRDDVFNNGHSRHIMGARQGEDALPGFVLPTKASRVVRTSKLVFDGHVYNLQTRSGYFVTGGIITHNCKCYCRSVVEGFS